MSRPQRRAKKRLAIAQKIHANTVLKDHNGGKGFTKPGAQKHW